MLPTLQLGPLAIQVPGLIGLIGLWLGLILAERQSERCGLKGNDLYNLVFFALISGIIGARLAYWLRYPQAFAASPFSLLSLNPGLLDQIGGLAAAALGGMIYIQRKGLSVWSSLDALTPALAVFQVSLGLAHLASGSAYGAPVDLPWAIELWGSMRHPSQIYEILASCFILVLVWPARGRLRPGIPGVYFLSFLALSSGSRLFLEAFRGDSPLLALGLRTAQTGAWLLLAASLVGIHLLRFKKVKETTNQP